MTTTPHRRVAWESLSRFLVAGVLLGMLLGNVTESYVAGALKGAFARLTGKEHYSAGMAVTVDARGIPYTEYTGGAKPRNPVTVCIKADEYYAKDDPAAKERFLNCADWLVEHAVAHKGYSLLEYDFPYSRYGMTAPWRSALANGMALTALTRAHARTGSLRYLTTARALMAAFHVPEDEGGFAVAMPQGVWYEEYADEGGTRPRVLNGMIFALFGLHDIYSYLGDRDAKRLFEDGVAAVKAELPRYDNRGHSYYDLLGNDPGPYHAIHVEQLAKLYALTNEPVFKQYHDRWAAYREPTYVTRLLTRPTPLRVAVAGVNAAAIWLLMLGLWALRRRR